VRNITGLRKGGGRPKGARNKTTVVFKDAIMRAFHGLGGVAALQRWGEKNQTEFYKIAARLIPTEVTGDPEAPLQHKVTFGGRYKP